MSQEVTLAIDENVQPGGPDGAIRAESPTRSGSPEKVGAKARSRSKVLLAAAAVLVIAGAGSRKEYAGAFVAAVTRTPPTAGRTFVRDRAFPRPFSGHSDRVRVSALIGPS